MNYSSFRDELVKIALTRWQKEEAFGERYQVGKGNFNPRYPRLGFSESDSAYKQRVEAFNARKVKAQEHADVLREKRQKMWGGGTDLTPEQLKRHERLAELQAKSSIRRAGGRIVPEMDYRSSYTAERDFKPHLGTKGSPGGVLRSTAAHEIGEAGIMKTKPHKIIGKVPETELHGDPAHVAIQEAQVSSRSPSAQKDIARARTGRSLSSLAHPEGARAVGPDVKDKRVAALMRQMGHRPTSPMPPYGRQHRALSAELIRSSMQPRDVGRLALEEASTRSRPHPAISQFWKKNPGTSIEAFGYHAKPKQVRGILKRPVSELMGNIVRGMRAVGK